MKPILLEQIISVPSTSDFDLLSISVTTPPDKVSYLSGEKFSKEGMVVTGYYGIAGQSISSLAVDITNNVIITPETLTDGVTEVKISIINHGGEEVSTTCPVTVQPIPIGFTVNIPEDKIFEYGDTFGGTLYITVAYSNQTMKSFTISYPEMTLNTLGINNFVVAYTENGVTLRHNVQITVEKKSISRPRRDDERKLTYSGGEEIDVLGGPSWATSLLYYWEGDSSMKYLYKDYFTFSGTTAATNAGTYSIVFTPNTNYRWRDTKDSEPYTTAWTIEKAPNTLDYRPLSMTIDSDNLIKGVGLEGNWDGPYSFDPIIAGITMSIDEDNRELVITGDGITDVEPTEITVTMIGTNYESCSFVVTVSTDYNKWDWGDETGDADEGWFRQLKEQLPKMSSEEKESLLGKTKSITLTNNVKGTTTHLIRCIGVDQDGENTIAFQTANCLASVAKWSSVSSTDDGSAANWMDSRCYAKQYCNDYYSAFPGKAYIKTVKKGTCDGYGSRSHPSIYNDETVFLPSEREMGLDKESPLSVANSTTTNAECTYGYNDYYHYYTNDDLRIKKKGDSGSVCIYWERSRWYGAYGYVCTVSDSGNAQAYAYWGTYYIAPAFVIG